MRVVLFHDEVGEMASPDEADVVTQMDAIAAALADLGHESVRVPCTLNLEAAGDYLRSAKPDIVFNLVESIGGQGRLISLAPQLLESLGLRYTGCPAAATFTTSGKPLSKQILAAANIATPAWHSLEQLRTGVAIMPGRYILKSSWEHASRGIDDDSIVEATNAAELSAALQCRLPALAGEGFAEEYIEGREFNLSVLCGEVLPAAEIVFENFATNQPRIVGFAAKWDEGSNEYTHTPRRFDFPSSDVPLLGTLADIAAACWRLFGLRGYARVDFRVDADNKPWVLEVNSNPCLSPDAGFAAAVARAGTHTLPRLSESFKRPRLSESTPAFRDDVRPEDAAAVRSIVASTGFFHDFEVDVAVELVRERLARGLASEYYFLFAEEHGRTIGYACFGPIPCTQGSFDLYWIAVHQDFQKRGLGGSLLTAAESMMRSGLPGADGSALPAVRRVYIETSSQPKYRPTQFFYERCGYKEEARLKSFYAPGDDKLIYVKALA